MITKYKIFEGFSKKILSGGPPSLWTEEEKNDLIVLNFKTDYDNYSGPYYYTPTNKKLKRLSIIKLSTLIDMKLLDFYKLSYKIGLSNRKIEDFYGWEEALNNIDDILNKYEPIEDETRKEIRNFNRETKKYNL